MTRTGTMKLGGGVELRFTRHDDESVTIERVIGPLTMPPEAKRAGFSDVLNDRLRMVVTPAGDKEGARF